MRASRNAVDRTRGRTVTAVLALGALIAAAVPSGVAAQTPREAREEAAPLPAEGAQPIVGIWPDMALSVGAGIGVDEVLDSNVFLRLRLGGLLAFEPWVLNLGVTGELGALAEWGAGVELELNHMSGPWLQINASRVEHERFMGHLGLGYFVVGVEWQHAFGDEPDDAVLFVLRLPIGLLWFMPDHAPPSEPGG